MADGVIVIDKPEGWTSHDVVGKLRGILRERRVGHAGTLDPMATGVLPVFAGRATRAVEFAAAGDKEYVAGLRLGVVTDTQDTTGKVLETRPAAVTQEELAAVLPRFTGEIFQVPPMYSAVKINGKKLYELARAGKEAERRARPVTIYELELLGRTDGGEYQIRAVCSKGTYVRTLCHEIGMALGCGAAMSFLRRTRAAGFSLAQALTLDEVADAPDARALLRPVDSLFLDLPALTVDAAAERRVRNGAACSWQGAAGRYRVYGPAGNFLMLGQVEDGNLTTIKSFFEV